MIAEKAGCWYSAVLKYINGRFSGQESVVAKGTHCLKKLFQKLGRASQRVH